jgi:D-alanyl-D-alanine dipeptidase
LTVKRNRNHKILALLLCLAVALSLLTGCGGSKAEQSSAAGSAASSAPEERAAAESEPEAESAPEESAQESAPEEVSQSAGEEEPEEEIYTTTGEDGITISNDASDFVLLSEAVPDAILEIRYYSTYNFVGQRVKGYEQPVALLTKEAASALKEVSDDLVERGYRLKIFDAYRPQMAVTNFVEWAEDLDDTRMKPYFYPELDKSVLFEQGYIAAHSGHSRGSTLDLTLFDMNTEREVDMGGTFDYFGELSHPDYKGVTDEQYKMRMLLREVMVDHGFRPLSEEWWHFTLEDEPYPDTYFTFPVNEDSVK